MNRQQRRACERGESSPHFVRLVAEISLCVLASGTLDAMRQLRLLCKPGSDVQLRVLSWDAIHEFLEGPRDEREERLFADVVQAESDVRVEEEQGHDAIENTRYYKVLGAIIATSEKLDYIDIAGFLEVLQHADDFAGNTLQALLAFLEASRIYRESAWAFRAELRRTPLPSAFWELADSLIE